MGEAQTGRPGSKNDRRATGGHAREPGRPRTVHVRWPDGPLAERKGPGPPPACGGVGANQQASVGRQSSPLGLQPRKARCAGIVLHVDADGPGRTSTQAPPLPREHVAGVPAAAVCGAQDCSHRDGAASSAHREVPKQELAYRFHPEGIAINPSSEPAGRHGKNSFLKERSFPPSPPYRRYDGRSAAKNDLSTRELLMRTRQVRTMVSNQPRPSGVSPARLASRRLAGDRPFGGILVARWVP